MTNFLFIFLASLLSTCMFIYLYSSLTDLNLEFNYFNKLLIIFGSFVISSLNYFDLPNFNLILYFIFFPILFRKDFTEHKKEIFIYIIVVWIYAAIIDLMFLLILSLINDHLFKINIDEGISILISSLLVTLTVIKISSISFLKNYTRKVVKRLYKIALTDILLILFVLFLIILGLLLIKNFDNPTGEMLLFLVIILSAISVFLLLLYIFQNYEIKDFIINVENNNNYYISLNNENRIFKHNLKANLLSIRSVASDKAASLIDDFIVSQLNDKNYYSDFELVPYGLIGIIFNKLSPYKETIKIDVKNELDVDLFEILRPKLYNLLVERVSILLDNAIEATLVSEDKVIQIFITYKGEELVICIINTFSSTIDLDQLGNIDYSSKGNSHGLGLFSIFRNNNVLTKVEIKNNLFVAKLIVKLKKENL